MMTTITSWVRQSRNLLRRLSLEPRLRLWTMRSGQFLWGFCMSAASLGSNPQPLALGLTLSAAGSEAVMLGLGASLGYLLFWGRYGYGMMLAMVPVVLFALMLGNRHPHPLLLPALGALIMAALGLFLQLGGGIAPRVPIYLLQVGLGFGATLLYSLMRRRRDPITDWLVAGSMVLALGQIAPVSWMNLGFVSAGVLGAGGAFPVAALAGLALDLGQVTKVPMGAVMCMAYFLRLLPWRKRWMQQLLPAMSFVLVAVLTGARGLAPLPALALGGCLSVLLPDNIPVSHRRGETGIAQVRLEMAAGVLHQVRELLLQVQEPPIDEEALMQLTAERACGSCPCRKGCKDRENASRLCAQELHRTVLTYQDLPFSCRKTGRILSELQRSREQLRGLKANRQRQSEYRSALLQQYRFLGTYLQELSDCLSRRCRIPVLRYEVRVQVFANREREDNGDRCCWFAGTEGKYYVLLCDGMGTGMGAVCEGTDAARMLKSMLCAGFPAEHALASVNSLCALRGQAGAVTMDLAEILLDSGRVTVYKWGAPPSFLITELGPERVGVAGPPPGLSVTGELENVERLSLRRGEMLVLTSDGAGGEECLHGCTCHREPEMIGRRLVSSGDGQHTDDATAVIIRLTAC